MIHLLLNRAGPQERRGSGLGKGAGGRQGNQDSEGLGDGGQEE